MRIVKSTLFFLLFFSLSSVFGQYTDVINSNKPGFSESPYSVGSGIYQFETSFFYRKISIEPTFSIPESIGADFIFRTSFFSERLEFNTQIAYQKDKVAFKNIFTSHYFTTGLSKVTFGAKYLVFQQKYTDKSKEIRSWKRRISFDYKRLIPSVAVYAGVNSDFINDIHKRGYTPKVGILLQNDITNQFNLITNVFYDYIGTDFSEISYIVTATVSFSPRWSTFFEAQGMYQKYKISETFGAGFAYLFNKNLQINASFRGVFDGDAKGFYTGLGVSYRINRHIDSFTQLDDNGNPLVSPKKRKSQRKKKGFFKRFLNIFKKN